MKQGRAYLVVVVACLLGAGVTGAPVIGSAAVAAPRWVIQDFPRPTLPNGDFTGVACPTASECLAVGFAGVPGALPIPDDSPLAALRTGAGWKLLTTPTVARATTSTLSSVTCWSASGCVAVGQYRKGSAGSRAFAEMWNGTRFSAASLPSPARATAVHLESVSCLTAMACYAVGYAALAGEGVTLAESWDGHHWKLMTTPDRPKALNDLTAVSCASGRCLAVGYASSSTGEVPISASLKGSTWTLGAPVAPAATRAILSGLACSSATSCTAVGTYEDTDSHALIDSWNGSRWTLAGLPADIGWLQAVSCRSSTACMAVGVGDSVLQAMSWNGTSWRPSGIVTPPAPDKSATSASGVSCSSASACLAVGVTASIGDNSEVTLAERLSGTAWKLVPSPDEPGPTHVKWLSDSCVSATRCLAVGQYWYNQGDAAVVYYPTYLGLAEEWNGHAWSILSSSALGMQQYGANGGWQVSCVSATSCIVTGSSKALHWNGSSFSVMPVASVSRSPRFRVFCLSSTDCYSSGIYLAQSISPAPYIDHWNGADWSTEYPPIPANTVTAGLSGGIACRSATSCVGVGTYETSSADFGFVETLAGGHWTLGSLPYPKGAYNVNMNSVSCTASACMAMASSDDAQETFADRWNGTSWVVEPTALPSVDNGGVLLGVSCPATDFCLSVGYGMDRDTFGDNPVTELWNGSKWSIDPVVYPAPHPYLGVVSCSAPGACTAVGAQIERYVA